MVKPQFAKTASNVARLMVATYQLQVKSIRTTWRYANETRINLLCFYFQLTLRSIEVYVQPVCIPCNVTIATAVQGDVNRLTACDKEETFLISNFCCVVNVAFFLSGDSLGSEFCVLTFQNTLSVPSTQVAWTRPTQTEQTKCSEMLAQKIQMLGVTPKRKNTTRRQLFRSTIPGSTT